MDRASQPTSDIGLGIRQLATLRQHGGPKADRSLKVALVGGFLPRKCGIATFTTDVFTSLTTAPQPCAVDVYAMAQPNADIVFDAPVIMPIVEGDRATFIAAACDIESRQPDVVWLQHEFGLYGGPAGDMIFELLDRVAAPLVVTLHTVLSEPNADQRRVMERLIARSAMLVVMTETGVRQLREVYDVSSGRIALIAHGVPDRPFGRSAAFKEEYGLAGKNVLMTFGLLSPGKGVECVIEALPAIVQAQPETVYCVVGATHPNLVAQEGEAYRDRLMALAESLGVATHVRWYNSFVETPKLLDMLEMADIYITPYLGANQATSGTLSYAVALGKAVISTPYLHATELLADGHGVLVPFADSAAIARSVIGLLADPAALDAMQRKAYRRGRAMIWPRFAEHTVSVVEKVRVTAGSLVRARAMTERLATPSFDGVLRLSDDTGMYQHSKLAVPDRAHGYCIDDNVRALMLMNRVGETNGKEAERLSIIYAAFVQHAWHADTQSFRNFMGFARNWLEDEGSEDSNGRTLWALGATAAEGRTAAIRDWASCLFNTTAHIGLSFSSPRAIAFAALGAAMMLKADPANKHATRIADHAADVLMRLLAAERRPDWTWFEIVLAYDNCRLPEAMLRLGEVCDRPDLLECGLDTLAWVMARQTSPAGMFRPVGSESFGRERAILPFDQQPVEAWAAIDACAAAFDVTRDAKWVGYAERAYEWFLGANDRGVSVADPRTGSCCDGINPHGVNLNEGAESTLAFQLGHASLAALLTKSKRGSRVADTNKDRVA